MTLTYWPNGILAGQMNIGTPDSNVQLPAGFQTLTASGAVTPGIQALQLSHATVAIAADLTGSLLNYSTACRLRVDSYLSGAQLQFSVRQNDY